MFVSLPTRHRSDRALGHAAAAAALWLAFLWASTRPGGPQQALLLDWGALERRPAAGGHLRVGGRRAWLRLFTALFLHADWAHLLGNLVFLLIFGLPAERAMGPWRFLLLFLLGGAVANLVAVLASAPRTG